ncbi:MAG: hypothetical protein Q3976_10535, partial [Corynebacterium sp.]|nr:hypothetical protein [Corynebacterium sp.]
GVSALARSIVYGSIGAAITSLVGAGIGAALGALASYLSHVRIGAGNDGGVNWLDARLTNQGGFGDVLSFLPGLSGAAGQSGTAAASAQSAVVPAQVTGQSASSSSMVTAATKASQADSMGQYPPDDPNAGYSSLRIANPLYGVDTSASEMPVASNGTIPVPA